MYFVHSSAKREGRSKESLGSDSLFSLEKKKKVFERVGVKLGLIGGFFSLFACHVLLFTVYVGAQYNATILPIVLKEKLHSISRGSFFFMRPSYVFIESVCFNKV